MSNIRTYPIRRKERCSCSGSNLDRFLQPNILVLLAEESMHGYSIIQKLEEKEKELYKCEKFDNTGVYRALRSLENRGMIESHIEMEGAGIAKRTYRITKEGMQCLAKWVDTLVEYQNAIDRLTSDIEHALNRETEKGK